MYRLLGFASDRCLLGSDRLDCFGSDRCAGFGCWLLLGRLLGFRDDGSNGGGSSDACTRYRFFVVVVTAFDRVAVGITLTFTTIAAATLATGAATWAVTCLLYTSPSPRDS